MPVMFLQQFDLSLAHSIARRRFVMIVAEHVQDSVHDEQCDLIVDGAGMIGCLALGDSWAEHYIAEQQRHVAGVGRRTIGTTTRGHSVQHDLGF